MTAGDGVFFYGRWRIVAVCYDCCHVKPRAFRGFWCLVCIGLCRGGRILPVGVGDVIVGLNDTAVADSADLRNAVGLLRAGAEVRVQLYRDGDLRTVTARIKDPGGFTAGDRGLAARLVGAKFRAASPNDEHDGGVEVTDIEPDSAASRSGLQEHDIVLSVGRRPVKTRQELEAGVRRADTALLIKLLRERRMLFLVIQ